MHFLHLPMLYGWKPKSARALLSKIVPERSDGKGNMVPCETWDNAILACDVEMEGRLAPGNANT
ncbi:hypothetical protein LOZ80_04955 [Paenibacillus sp. HWE-109]|uniref:hypothetical protein n=1 Tax=Paenibacillus sp. HWE-109 TaxID=1306526 RepID=UPI001EE0C1F8|nr:hypothetical protein [Paenibacillus sp. HWE-109]UKS28288.1 hypothetical protein LOZ80_04955 [Paenibacillus sp. HWE-109]